MIFKGLVKQYTLTHLSSYCPRGGDYTTFSKSIIYLYTHFTIIYTYTICNYRWAYSVKTKNYEQQSSVLTPRHTILVGRNDWNQYMLNGQYRISASARGSIRHSIMQPYPPILQNIEKEFPHTQENILISLWLLLSHLFNHAPKKNYVYNDFLL
jgi:hypothetical protein